MMVETMNEGKNKYKKNLSCSDIETKIFNLQTKMIKVGSLNNKYNDYKKKNQKTFKSIKGGSIMSHLTREG